MALGPTFRGARSMGIGWGSGSWRGGFGDVLAGWSCSGPVAYVEADYFGGVGEQRAAVWDAGRLSLGPLYKGVDEAFPAEGSPISQALRYLGVQRGEHYDEFDAVGLLRHRRTEAWIEDAAAAGGK